MPAAHATRWTPTRGTRYLDVNVFVPPERADEVFAALPSGVRVTRADGAAVRRDGQARVMWDDTPLDLFFDTHDFHRSVADHVRLVPFEGRTIPVLSCTSLTVFKALCGRARDWADIEEMLAVGDGTDALDLVDLVGPGDPATVRLRALIGD